MNSEEVQKHEDKRLRDLDLGTMEDIKFMMELYSDGTVFTLGYRRLCEMVKRKKELENG